MAFYHSKWYYCWYRYCFKGLSLYDNNSGGYSKNPLVHYLRKWGLTRRRWHTSILNSLKGTQGVQIVSHWSTELEIVPSILEGDFLLTYYANHYDSMSFFCLEWVFNPLKIRKVRFLSFMPPRSRGRSMARKWAPQNLWGFLGHACLIFLQLIIRKESGPYLQMCFRMGTRASKETQIIWSYKGQTLHLRPSIAGSIQMPDPSFLEELK